jgi:hypothetical protein
MNNTRINHRIGRMTRWTTVVALLVVAFAGSPAWSESRGRCAWVEVPWPMTLPDGSAHEAGRVKLCLQQMWTPASGLHEIQVNGASRGLFMSRAGSSEGPISDLPVVVFQKYETGEYHLIGYAWPDGDSMRTYVLHQSGKAPSATAWNKRKKRLPLFETEDHEILAALVR